MKVTLISPLEMKKNITAVAQRKFSMKEVIFMQKFDYSLYPCYSIRYFKPYDEREHAFLFKGETTPANTRLISRNFNHLLSKTTAYEMNLLQ